MVGPRNGTARSRQAGSRLAEEGVGRSVTGAVDLEEVVTVLVASPPGVRHGLSLRRRGDSRQRGLRLTERARIVCDFTSGVVVSWKLRSAVCTLAIGIGLRVLCVRGSQHQHGGDLVWTERTAISAAASDPGVTAFRI